MILIIDKLTLLYLKPKKIESFRGRSIYELIGISFYKKYFTYIWRPS